MMMAGQLASEAGGKTEGPVTSADEFRSSSFLIWLR
jgi:hypothetical protein